LEMPLPLKTGEEAFQSIVLAYGVYGDDSAAPEGFVFPRPGRYTLRVVYVDEGLQAEAIPVSVTVEAPAGQDAEVFRLIGGNAFEISYGGPVTGGLLATYPTSPYLRSARLDRFRSREVRLANSRNPDTDEPLWNLSQSDRDAFSRDFYRRMTQDILRESDWGSFEEIRLSWAASYAEHSGDLETTRRIQQEILERFPRSVSANLIRRRSDTEPPTLAVVASPTTLWPPNHKLEAVSVAVTVIDNVDPNPVVKLVSITCDDGCDPSKDISAATLNSDVRQFQLRAERLGTGSGRTYTITYSATDASGNTATKTTTVTANSQRLRTRRPLR